MNDVVYSYLSSDSYSPLVKNQTAATIYLRRQRQVYANFQSELLYFVDNLTLKNLEMAVKVAMINMKGGVGKSTLTVNLAWHIAMKTEHPHKVLVVDLDP